MYKKSVSVSITRLWRFILLKPLDANTPRLNDLRADMFAEILYKKVPFTSRITHGYLPCSNNCSLQEILLFERVGAEMSEQ